MERARKAGSWREVDLVRDPEKFKQGDYLAGPNDLIGQPVLHPGVFPWIDSPLVGYRDYLRDGWMANQRFEPVIGGPSKEVSSPGTLTDRRNHSFHQDFTTKDISPQPANRVLISIMTGCLPLRKGMDTDSPSRRQQLIHKAH